jgi:hypothetical protein
MMMAYLVIKNRVIFARRSQSRFDDAARAGVKDI